MQRATLLLILLTFFIKHNAQVPVAGFSVFPNPVCIGSPVQITDLSTGSPLAWSYTVSGTPPINLTTQNPTLQVNSAVNFTISQISSNSFGSSSLAAVVVTVSPLPATAINPTVLVTTCPNGTPLTLTAVVFNPTWTYSWSTGVNTVSTNVSPSVNTVYSLNITTSAGCSKTFTKSVISSTSLVSIAAYPLTVCGGAPVKLTASAVGASPYTYSWSTGVSTNTLSTVVPGVYTVTLTTANQCQDILSYTINSSTTLSLAINAASTSVCVPPNNVISLAANGATSYTWSNGSNSSSLFVTPTVTTTYSLAGSGIACSGTAAITINVNNTPTLSLAMGATTICMGDTITLAVSGAVNYTWNTGSTTSLAVVSPSTNTTYSVIGLNAPCPASSFFISIMVNPIPTLSIASSKSIACIGDKLVLTAAGANTYTWNTGATQYTAPVMPNASTVYSVLGKALNGCKGSATYSLNTVKCVGIEEAYEKNQLKTFPVPGKEIMVQSILDQELQLIDQSGQMIETYSIKASEVLIIKGMRPGYYYLRPVELKSSIKPRIIVIE